MRPLVSILIPAYNAEQWISETLESALAQTWQHKEVIVINDGSTDNTLTVAKKYELSSVKVINQENRGASAARNRALQEAQGELIQYLDADDLLAPDKIERQIQVLEEGNSEWVIAGKWSKFKISTSKALFIPQPLWCDMPSVDWLVCAWQGNWMMHPAAWLINHKIAEKVGPWNEALSYDDDGEYFCRVVLASEGVKFCNQARTYYRTGIATSLSCSKSRASRESALHSIELKMNYLLAREDSQRTRSACAAKFQCFIYEVYPFVPDLAQKAEAKVQFLGGSDVKPYGYGPLFQPLCKVVGWKRAKKIEQLLYQYARGLRDVILRAYPKNIRSLRGRIKEFMYFFR